MSEEKEAIEEVKKIINYIEDNYTCNCDREDKKYFEIVLNLIDKLQKQLDQLKDVDRQICNEELITKDKYQEILKENAELTNELSKIQCDNRQMEEDSISKDTIRTKIKELENTYSEHSEFRIGKTIEILNELLGE